MENEIPVGKNKLAEELGVSVRTIYRWIAEGLPAHKAGKGQRLYFYWSEVNDWIKGEDIESTDADSR